MTEGVGSAMQIFLERNSPGGLFLRYARGRTRDFLARQVMTGVGAATLAALGAPWMGVAAVLMAVGGEAVDCLLLHHLLHRQRTDALARRMAAITAAVQGLTIAACVTLCWRFIPVAEARIFAAAFLMAAVINAGLVRRHFPEGTHARIAVYAMTGAGMLGYDLWENLEHPVPGEWFFLLAMLIIAYTATLFISAVEKGQAERVRFERALLEEQSALRTAQSRLSEAARKAERLALVARHANDSVIFTRPDGRIEWVNEAFTRTTGYSFAEAVGQIPSALLDAPDTSADALATLRRAQQEGRPCRLELRNRRRDGQLIWMEVSMTPVLRPDGSPEVFIAVERDVTEAKAHAAELAKARQEAEAAAQAKSQFLATMSHEIRTPMNGVIGVAELLEDTKLDRTQRQYTGTIIDSARALLTVINDVLDLSKLQAGKAELRAEPFAVADCLTGAFDLLRPTARAKGITLSAEIPAHLPRHRGDAGRLRQILLNLIGNAVKFTAEGQVSAVLGIHPEAPPSAGGKAGVEAGEAPDILRIAIADTGIGIAADRIGHVFESFTQADPGISRQFGGTGLGLTISRLLAQQMGGDIEVASVLGQGSVFTLTIRLSRVAETPLPAEPARAPVPETRLHVLLAEDNRTNRLIARKLLERSVATLAEAANGRSAVDMYRAKPPDLVLMDVSMPEMDGLEATRAIRAHEAASGLRHCPIHALTAYSSADQEAACLEAGLDGVLTKPLARAELYALLTRIAAERDHFDLSPGLALDEAEEGGSPWSISPQGSTTTIGKSTRS